MWSSMKITLPLIWDQNKFPSGGWWKVSLLSVCVHFWHTDTKWTQSLTTNFCLVSKFSIIEWQSGYQEKEYQSISSSCTSVWSSREIYFQTWGSGCSSSLLQVRKKYFDVSIVCLGINLCPFDQIYTCSMRSLSITYKTKIDWICAPKLRLISQPYLLYYSL